MTQPFAVTVDARQYATRDRHRVIVETFEALQSGAKMELINDHDPKPLYYEFKAERDGTFTWQYLEQGPKVWRVIIKKV